MPPTPLHSRATPWACTDEIKDEGKARWEVEVEELTLSSWVSKRGYLHMRAMGLCRYLSEDEQGLFEWNKRVCTQRAGHLANLPALRSRQRNLQTCCKRKTRDEREGGIFLSFGFSNLFEARNSSNVAGF